MATGLDDILALPGGVGGIRRPEPERIAWRGASACCRLLAGARSNWAGTPGGDDGSYPPQPGTAVAPNRPSRTNS